ncbi:MAG: SlyX family protein [Gammaproteobacteria bacterium]|nr:SlyX family protein [Gammaproteobacteria bacterium]
MNDDMIERIELRLVWLESANQEMSEELYRQQREIEVLRLRLGKVQERLDEALAEAAEEHSPFDPAAERPPHY